ncbi:MAG: helix-turn-helix transcriptional regulator [Bacteroidetes bacterium]|nr:helix-turn-helix transcriptional regulator [Rhodothermia bacterium]MCS7155958.1 helix-turn-helix transcriptional regulator [Bacteroidota bacterium]MCX7905964.1 helix-turn-helix transcriptional regulator [Bacteroidota bacterium]MDW8138069.1 helix-turn-helix domain-containing protein [Bacteroidota bacterium]MDW8285753.1 helix-turn-helix domain-containing protein [Bacteroidota bacterium]
MSEATQPKRSPKESEAFCPVYAAVDLLQAKWTLHIVRALLEGDKGFNELARAVGGCNPATLTQRLEHLVAVGVISKTVESHMPPRTRYRLTEAGRALEAVIASIEAWARRYLPHQVAG